MELSTRGGISVEKDIVNMEQKRIEQALSQIGSKIADATQLSQKAAALTIHSETLLIDAQKEIENLYISFGQQED